MSENIQSISQGTYTIGQTSATNFVAGPGIRIDEPSAGTVRIGNDETVLYSGDGSNLTLSEDIHNFERLRFKVDPGQGMKYIEVEPVSTLTFGTFNGVGTAWIKFFRLSYDNTLHKFTVQRTKAIGVSFDNTNVSWQASIDGDIAGVKEIVGINRISGSNA